MSRDKTYWVLVERLANWEIDKRDGFRQFGLPDRKLKLGSEIKEGDLLIFYVSSGISSFADVREAAADGVSKLPLGGNYDTAFPWRVATRPCLSLPREAWVPMKSLAHRLSLTAGKADWRQVMRTSLLRLSTKDGNLITAAMRRNVSERVADS